MYGQAENQNIHVQRSFALNICQIVFSHLNTVK